MNNGTSKIKGTKKAVPGLETVRIQFGDGSYPVWIHGSLAAFLHILKDQLLDVFHL